MMQSKYSFAYICIHYDLLGMLVIFIEQLLCLNGILEGLPDCSLKQDM